MADFSDWPSDERRFISVSCDELDRMGIKGPLSRVLPFLRALDDLRECLGDEDFPRALATLLTAFEADFASAAAVSSAPCWRPESG